MAIKKGDFVKIDYTGRLTDGAIFDTTSEKEAQAAKIFDEKGRYKPVLVIVGKGQAVRGLDEAIDGMNVGDEKEITVPPEKGFGMRDPNLLNVVPLSQFEHEKVNPAPGMVVSIDNRDGTVKSVGGGRVIVDFNHPLAGQELKYKMKVVSLLETTQDKSQAIFEDSGLEGSVTVKGDVLSLNLKANASTDFILRKQSLIGWISDSIPEVKTVSVSEEYETSDVRRQLQR